MKTKDRRTRIRIDVYLKNFDIIEKTRAIIVYSSQRHKLTIIASVSVFIDKSCIERCGGFDSRGAVICFTCQN